MKKNLILLLPTILFCSCSTFYYKTNAVNTPMFTHGGQAHLSAGVGFGENYGQSSSFADIQASYSPIDHVGILFNYSANSYTNADYSSNGTTSNKYITNSDLTEGAIGGYIATTGRYKLVNELYAGAGHGNVYSFANLGFNRAFLQYGIGMRSRYIDAIFNMRFSDLTFTSFDPKGLTNSDLLRYKLIDYNGRRIDDGSAFFLEPSFTVRGGYRFIKAQLQLVFCAGPSVHWGYSNSRYTAGIYFALEDLVQAIRAANNRRDEQ
ncbi:MAG: hypothetical protein H0X33_09595 [Taibaiella sp.]|nr:hypothetical protein [Taibaiella sp.]